MDYPRASKPCDSPPSSQQPQYSRRIPYMQASRSADPARPISASSAASPPHRTRRLAPPPEEPLHERYSPAVPARDTGAAHHAHPATASRSAFAPHLAFDIPTSHAPSPPDAPRAAAAALQHPSHAQDALPRPPPVSGIDAHHCLQSHAPQAATHIACALTQSPLARVRRFVGPLSEHQFVEYSSTYLDYSAFEHDNCSFSLPLYSQPESLFFSVVKPELPTTDYMKRLVTYTHCSPSAFVVMLVYMDRVARSNRKLVVTAYNMHRLLITALTLACKNLDDQCFANAHYAKVGGIPTVREMNRLELQFLKFLGYQLYVSREEYGNKIRQLSAYAPTSPTSVNGHSFSPPPGPTKMDVNRKLPNTARPYHRVLVVTTKSQSGSFREADGNPYSRDNASGSNKYAMVREEDYSPEVVEKAMRKGVAFAYDGVGSRANDRSIIDNCSHRGMEKVQVCPNYAPVELSYVTSSATPSAKSYQVNATERQWTQ